MAAEARVQKKRRNKINIHDDVGASRWEWWFSAEGLDTFILHILDLLLENVRSLGHIFT